MTSAEYDVATWSPQSFSISVVVSGSPVFQSVDGEVCGPFGIHQRNRTWCLDHLASGRKISEVLSPEHGKALAVRLVRLTRGTEPWTRKWTTSEETPKEILPILHLIQTAIAEARGETR